MSELNEIQKALWIAFNLGLKVGQIECRNSPLSNEGLKTLTVTEHSELKRLIKWAGNNGN
jgi:hypothetical protein